MNVRHHNRLAWNKKVDQGNRWTQPVSRERIQKARQGEIEVLLTPSKPVPTDWFPKLAGTKTLCLASAGGQQAPLFAATGAIVTVFDNSPRQLEQDRYVAEREELKLDLIEGDMRDLSELKDGSFDLVFHPCSNVFVPNILPVWQECHRVLRQGGFLLAGFTNPVRYIFDDERKENGNLEVRYPIPYSDLKDLSEPDLQQILAAEQPLEFGHTLDDQIAGQLDAGFHLVGFYEDRYSDTENDCISNYLPTFIATRAYKP